MLSDSQKKIIESFPAILSTQEMAVYFSFDRRTIYRLIKTGKLPAWKDEDGAYCIAKVELLEYCSERSNL